MSGNVDNVKPKKRKRWDIKAMELAVNAVKTRSSKSNIVAKSLSNKKCNSDNPKSKPKPNKAMQKKCSSSSASDNDIEDTDDDVDENEEDAECLYCNGLFSQDTRGDKWIRCSLCFRWCHDECAGSDKKAFVCEICLDS
ncbi:hypothetical protein FQA39_LY17384 [Lamprigera yunnana]|nr:hypothetical protein FQA39_LY17384 [Lamprigera yunnana]